MLRAIVETFRGDAARGVFFGGRVSTSQIIAVPAALVALAMLRILSRRAAAEAARQGG